MTRYAKPIIHHRDHEHGGADPVRLAWESTGFSGLVGQFEIKVVADDTIVTTGDGKFIFAIPIDLDSTLLSALAAYVTTVSSSGTPTVQIRNVTTGHDMLTTPITIQAGDTTSYTSPAPPVVNSTYATVTYGDLIAVDVDAAGTGAKGLGVILTFAA